MKSLLLFFSLSIFCFGQDLNKLDSVQASQLANDFNSLNQKGYKFYKAVKSKQRPVLGFIYVDPTISDEFMKWVFAGKKQLKGLILRRQAEDALYRK